MPFADYRFGTLTTLSVLSECLSNFIQRAYCFASIVLGPFFFAAVAIPTLALLACALSTLWTIFLAIDMILLTATVGLPALEGVRKPGSAPRYEARPFRRLYGNVHATTSTKSTSIASHSGLLARNWPLRLKAAGAPMPTAELDTPAFLPSAADCTAALVPCPSMQQPEPAGDGAARCGPQSRPVLSDVAAEGIQPNPAMDGSWLATCMQQRRLGQVRESAGLTPCTGCVRRIS